MLPNFLIIGAARAGTTSLYTTLQSHPDVYLPRHKRPEPHFFLKTSEFAKGLAYYEQRFFSEWNGEHAVGEASTSYLYGASVPARIKSALPDAKFLCLLRNPVDRTFSGYWHTVASGLETLPFEEALGAEATRKRAIAGTAMEEIAPFAYVERSLYHEQLRRWFDVFGPTRLHVVLFEDLIATPPVVLDGIARFLGVDPAPFAGVALGKENTSVPEHAVMPAAVREGLIDGFRHDVAALERLLGRNLQQWLTATSAVSQS